MPASIPVWSDNTTVFAPQSLARGNTVRETLNLTAKGEAWLALAVGRTGTAALTNGMSVRISRMFGGDVAGARFPMGLVPLQTGTAAANSTTVNNDSNSGQPVLNLASTNGFAAGQIICVQDSGGGFTRLEFGVVSKVAAGVGITLDANLHYSHTAVQADTVRNMGECWQVPLPGGAVYEIVLDYGDDTSGEPLIVTGRAQVFDRWETS